MMKQQHQGITESGFGGGGRTLSLSLCVVALFLASKLTTISSSSSGAAKTVTTE